MNLPRYDDPRVIAAGNEAWGAVVRAAAYLEAHGLAELPIAVARLMARPRVWAAAVRAGLATSRGDGGFALSLGPTGPRNAMPSAVLAEPDMPVPPAQRSAEYRRRVEREVAEGLRDPVTRRRIVVTEHVTKSRDEGTQSVTSDVTTSRDAHSRVSPSESQKEEQIREERETREGGPSRDVTPLPSFSDPPPAFVAAVCATWAQTKGRALDPDAQWQKFLSNAHKRREAGQKAFAGEHDFRMWVAGSVQQGQGSPARGRGRGPIVQGGPRKPGLLPSWEDEEPEASNAE